MGSTNAAGTTTLAVIFTTPRFAAVLVSRWTVCCCFGERYELGFPHCKRLQSVKRHQLGIERGDGYATDDVVGHLLIAAIDNVAVLLVGKNGVGRARPVVAVDLEVCLVEDVQRTLNLSDVRAAVARNNMRRIGYGGSFKALIASE